MFSLISMTILLFLLALVFLIIVFGITWKFKGLKTALILTGILFIFIAGVFLAVFLVIPISMAA